MSPEAVNLPDTNEEPATSSGLPHDKADMYLGTTLGLGYEVAAVGGIVTKNYAAAAFCAVLGAGVLISTYSKEMQAFFDHRSSSKQ